MGGRMTELMKRYEDGGDIEYLDFLENENNQLKSLIKQLKEQLRWRHVSDPPKEDGFYLIVSLDLRLGVCTGTSWYRGKEFINIGPHEEVTQWLPIPPAPEGGRMTELMKRYEDEIKETERKGAGA